MRKLRMIIAVVLAGLISVDYAYAQKMASSKSDKLQDQAASDTTGTWIIAGGGQAGRDGT